MSKQKKKYFLYNKKNPNESSDIYSDDNPKDTIKVHYKTIEELKKTIEKLEKLFKKKKYNHKRIFQVGLIIKVRLEIMNKYRKTKYKKAKDVNKRFILSKKYYNFLKKRSKLKTFKERKNLIFNIE